MKAFCLIRSEPGYRAEAFRRGLEACGLTVTSEPDPTGVLVIWNRYGTGERWAQAYEKAGGTVLVAENGYFGRDWRGEHWYAIARSQHNGAGWWPAGDASRWDSWGVELQPWRDGTETVVLPQRGIGPSGVAMPYGWCASAARQVGGRVRPHPGESRPAVSLEDDLKRARCVVTWGSGAALKALTMGVPVFHGMPKWIGAGASALFAGDVANPVHGDRLATFRRLAWSMWNTDEIASGEPFRLLLPGPR